MLPGAERREQQTMRLARTDKSKMASGEMSGGLWPERELPAGGGAPEAAASNLAAFGERSDPAKRCRCRSEERSGLFATVRSDG